MGEQRAEEIADERDAVLGQPHDAAVDRLADGSEQLDAEPVDVEVEAFVERDVGRRHRLSHRYARVLFGDADGVGDQHVEPDRRRAHAQALDAFVVGLADGVVGLGDVGRAGLAEQVDAADVIDVSLGRDDVVRGPRADGVEDALVVRRLVAHAGVDDHPAAVGEHAVGGGGAARTVDEPVDDCVRRIVVGRDQQLLARPRIDEMVDSLLNVHWTSIRTGKRSRYAPKRDRICSGVVEKSRRRS